MARFVQYTAYRYCRRLKQRDDISSTRPGTSTIRSKMKVGFAVLYQWQIKPGKIRQFVTAWTDMTDALKAQRGALGSRLHRSEQGTWMAYAQWPNRATYERVGTLEPIFPDAFERLMDAVEDTWPPIFLTPHDDRLDPID